MHSHSLCYPMVAPIAVAIEEIERCIYTYDRVSVLHVYVGLACSGSPQLRNHTDQVPPLGTQLTSSIEQCAMKAWSMLVHTSELVHVFTAFLGQSSTVHCS